jgi:hypothetical protein
MSLERTFVLGGSSLVDYIRNESLAKKRRTLDAEEGYSQSESV